MIRERLDHLTKWAEENDLKNQLFVRVTKNEFDELVLSVGNSWEPYANVKMDDQAKEIPKLLGRYNCIYLIEKPDTDSKIKGMIYEILLPLLYGAQKSVIDRAVEDINRIYKDCYKENGLYSHGWHLCRPGPGSRVLCHGTFN